MKIKKVLLIMIFLSIFFMTKVEAKNIARAYVYDDKNEVTKCITGDEETCKETTCYQNREKNSCSPGTIIDYDVNNQQNIRFYVLHDDGETMTLQQRENTMAKIAWYKEEKNNSKGPLTILDELQKITSNWTNVNTQVFGDNIYTGCDHSTCSSMTYGLATKTLKSRLITIQETRQLGCSTTEKSCPIWLYNYLTSSTSFGGTINSTSSSSYCTMSANSSTSDQIWWIYCDGKEDTILTDTECGVRAVIEVNKEPKEDINGDIENKKQIVQPGDTLKNIYYIYIIGGIILIAGILLLLKMLKNKNNSN